MHFEERMSDADSLMWSIESDPILRSTILSIWVLDRMPDFARFATRAEQSTRIIPRLRQRVVVDPLGVAPPKWEEDRYFDLHFHLRRAALPPGHGTTRDLLDLAEPIAMQAFDKDRPLWELHLVEGLDGGRCAVIMKLHHAISDGVGLVKMTECLVEHGPDEVPVFVAPSQSTPNISGRTSTSHPAGRSSGIWNTATGDTWSNVTEALSHRWRDGADKARRFGAVVARNAASSLSHPVDKLNEIRDTLASVGRVLAPASEPLSPIMRDRSTVVRFEYLPIPLEDLKRAGKSADGTVNDAFVAGVAGGLARYHEALGAPVETLRMLMPVNVRAKDGSEKANRAGNQFAPARFEVPVGIANPVERMQAIGKLCRAQRDEPALPWMDEITNFLGVLPSIVTGNLLGAMQKTTDFTTSNVPGPRRPTWVSGARIEAFMPFGPIAGASVNVTAFSYDGMMHVGINMDRAAVADPRLLIECMQKGFEEVLAVGA
jgi:WS/DGAT/MGAT family acyltransferase